MGFKKKPSVRSAGAVVHSGRMCARTFHTCLCACLHACRTHIQQSMPCTCTHTSMHMHAHACTCMHVAVALTVASRNGVPVLRLHWLAERIHTHCALVVVHGSILVENSGDGWGLSARRKRWRFFDGGLGAAVQRSSDSSQVQLLLHRSNGHWYCPLHSRNPGHRKPYGRHSRADVNDP